MFTPKNGRSGLTLLDRPSSRLDRPSESSQKVIWTSPLDRYRRISRDPYIERPIRSPDERDMTSRRSPRQRGS
jgi:hypothetical protein